MNECADFLLLPPRSKEPNQCHKKERFPLWDVVLGNHGFIAHSPKFFAGTLECKIAVFETQTAVLWIFAVILPCWVLLKRQQT